MITCPGCGHPIPLTDALTGQIRQQLATEVKLDHERHVAAAVAAAQARASEQFECDLRLLREQLAEQQRKTRAAQDAELALRKDKAVLEERQRELDLEVARKLAAEKERLEDLIRKAAAEEQALKVKEKDKQIEDLKKLLQEAKRRSEQGSQEIQGEVLELDIQAALERQFPQDEVTLELETPLRLQNQGRPVSAGNLSPRALITALLRRASLLLELHADMPGAVGDAGALARSAERLTDLRQVKWRDWTRYSSRQKQEMTPGGVIGEWTLRGELSPLMPWLWLGQWLHVGKNATMGLGKYSLRHGDAQKA